jgi:hypothetical protein
VIGAPVPGQISITNPNPPAKRVAAPKVVAKSTRLGGKPVVKTGGVAKPKCKRGFKLANGLKGPVCVRITTPQTPPSNTNAPINQAFKGIGQTVGQVLTSEQKVIQGNVDALVHDITHPGGIVPHVGAEVSHEPDPARLLKEGLIEGVKSAKVKIVGIP